VTLPPAERSPDSTRDHEPTAGGPGLSRGMAMLPLWLRALVVVSALAGIGLAIYLLQQPALPVTRSTTDIREYGPLDARPPAKGEPAPDFVLPALDGPPVRLSDLRGTPVLINFWATWCSPCRAEMPDIQAAYAGAGGQLIVLAVNVEGTNAETARRLSRDFKDELGLTFPILLDTPEGATFDQYRLRGLPDSFFIDRDGIIRDVVIGPLSKRALDEKLQAIR
jgi:thiol-disulfide isomerase/thioredoxin